MKQEKVGRNRNGKPRTLVDELGDVRRLGYLNIESDAYKPCDFRTLRELAPLYAQSGKAFSCQVQELIRDAILGLPEGLDYNTALTVYDLLEYLPDDCPTRKLIGKDRHPVELRQAALGLWCSSKAIDMDTFRKGIELRIRRLIAARILALMDNLPHAQDAGEDKSAGSGTASFPRYVQRDALSSRFRKLEHEGAKCIALVGGPGMGKTWLAQAMTEGIQPIRILEGKMDVSDLQAVIAMGDIDIRGIISGEPREFLARLACDMNAPQYILLDNLASTDELNHLLPRGDTRSTIVATCRRSENPPDNCEIINVNEMTRAEAIEVVRRRLPDAPNEDAQLLADSLHYYPLAIGYACGLVEQRNVSIENFCADLDISLSVKELVAASIPTAMGVVLLAVIKDMIEFTWQRDRLAFDLLVCIGVIDARMIMPGNLVELLDQESGGLPRTRYAIALDRLRKLSIIEQNSRGQIKIHPLIRDVLYALFWQGACNQKVENEFAEALKRADQIIDSIEGRLWTWVDVSSGAATNGNFHVVSTTARLRDRPGGECARVCQTRENDTELDSFLSCIESELGVCRRRLESTTNLKAEVQSLSGDDVAVRLARDIYQEILQAREAWRRSRWTVGDLIWRPDDSIEGIE